MSVIAICAVLLAIIAAILIRNDKYEDGLIGRIALAGIILSGVIVVLTEFSEAVSYSAPPEVVMLIISMLAFMMRHLYRFVMYTKTGSGDWQKKVAHE